MRINKFLSSLGIASRRAIDKYIEEGRIKVNGVIASTGIDVTEDDEIYIDNKKITNKSLDEKFLLAYEEGFITQDEKEKWGY